MKPVLRASTVALLALAFSIPSTPAAAQFIQQLPDPNSPVERLGGFIRILAGNPRDLGALMGAGTAALDVGDANAALGFFSRAEEISPSNGRAKAGLGAALANIEKPDDALRLFGEAASLGARDTDFARDRALAYDLTGDWRRAQRDYQTALQTNPADDETVRRYALSLGISGNRAQALQVLDPLLRRQDQGAWRARAFIYAMTGDVAQANTVARQLMPAPMAASMSPLLSRLATLNAAERAHAVNFGTVPSNGTRLASADTSRALPPQAYGGQQPYVLQRAPTLAGAYAARPSIPTSTARSPSSGLIPSGEPLGRRVPAPVATVQRPVALAVREPLPPVARPVPVVPVAQAPRPLTSGTLSSGSLTTGRIDAGVGDSRSGQSTARFADGDPLAAASVARRIGPRLGPVDPSKLPAAARGEATTVTLLPAVPSPTVPRPTAVGNAARIDGASAIRSNPLGTSGSRVALAAPAPVVATPVTALPSTTPAPGFAAPSGAAITAPAAGDRPAMFGPPSASGTVSPAATAPLAESPAFETPTPGFSQPVPTPVGAISAADRVAAPTAQIVTPRPALPATRLAGLLSGLATEEESTAAELPSVRELRLARATAKRKAAEQAAQAAAKADDERAARAEAAQAADAERRNPARLWVQVATGANERGLPLTWRRIRDANVTALTGLGAYTVPFKATNRLLVGPLKTPAEARDLVRALGKTGVAASTYGSDAGQEVARVAGK